MALVSPTDATTTKRKALTPTQRLRLFEAHKGCCGLCGQKIQAGERWIVEHLRPLSLSGGNETSNLSPAHQACADAKTHGSDGDLARAAKAKRAKMKHVGISAPKQPIRSAGFPKPASQRSATKALEKRLPARVKPLIASVGAN